MLRERLSLRGMCRAVGVSLTGLLHFLVACLAICPDHCHARLPARPPREGWTHSRRKPTQWGALCRRRPTSKGLGGPWTGHHAPDYGVSRRRAQPCECPSRVGFEPCGLSRACKVLDRSL